MRVLSLFDGISCARVALERAGVLVEKYYASEVDKYAIQISKRNYPEIEHIGNVKEVDGNKFKDIDLLVGGSPCQDLSIAKNNRKGLDGERSGLFWEYVRILKEANPRYFILENVASMPKEAKEIITEALGVEPIMINAALVSAQNRKRLFWTNIPGVNQPEDRGIYLRDILEDGEADRLKSYCIDASYYKGGNLKSYAKGRRQLINVPSRLGHLNSGGQGDRICSSDGKSVSLSANGGGIGAKTGLYDVDKVVRKLTPIECERLQGLPDDYTALGMVLRMVSKTEHTSSVSNTQRYKCLGNAFNVDVVAHILSFIQCDE